MKGVEVVRTIALMQGQNTVGIFYEIRNSSGEDAALTVRPHLQFVPKGALLSEDQEFVVDPTAIRVEGSSMGLLLKPLIITLLLAAVWFPVKYLAKKKFSPLKLISIAALLGVIIYSI